ncbi:hypothetical protein DPX16_13143 [Anabarilius grahami]|uniref:Uncharacterized protein n=1 Tax=Anabarilius grahami TaxID=495550 RepID=A0A3N0YNX5_ANAGA|nr:hypothetical protein DPX16_13143 [Anabarilius grahami]
MKSPHILQANHCGGVLQAPCPPASALNLSELLSQRRGLRSPESPRLRGFLLIVEDISSALKPLSGQDKAPGNMRRADVRNGSEPPHLNPLGPLVLQGHRRIPEWERESESLLKVLMVFECIKSAKAGSCPGRVWRCGLSAGTETGNKQSVHSKVGHPLGLINGPLSLVTQPWRGNRGCNCHGDVLNPQTQRSAGGLIKHKRALHLSSRALRPPPGLQCTLGFAENKLKPYIIERRATGEK